MKSLALLVSLLLLGLVAAACGGDDDGETDEAASQQEFVDQASQICADANEEINQAQPDEAVPIIEEALSELEALTPPPNQQETFDQFIQEGREGLDTLQNAEAPPQGDPFGQFTRLGEELGIEGGCTRAGQGGQSG